MKPQEPNLQLRTQREADVTIVELAGEIDLRTAPRLRDAFIKLLDERPERIILALADVSYVDSSGVGTIVELKRRMARSGGDVILVGLRPRVRSLFEITRLDNFFTIVNTIDEARQA